MPKAAFIYSDQLSRHVLREDHPDTGMYEAAGAVGASAHDLGSGHAAAAPDSCDAARHRFHLTQ